MIMTILAIFSVILLMLVDEASAQSTYSVSVSRHVSTDALTDMQVRDILKEASKILQKNFVNNGDEDVACDVTFTLKGPVRTFGSADTPAIIMDKEQRDAVHKVDSDIAGVDFHIKVVDEIQFCKPDLDVPSFNGCAFPIENRSIIVVHPRRGFPDPILWAHEFGHLTGLGHRCSNCALMTLSDVAVLKSVERPRVNKKECGCLRGGLGSCELPTAELHCSSQQAAACP